jgi:putative SOS response-associated peptidase YedK
MCGRGRFALLAENALACYVDPRKASSDTTTDTEIQAGVERDNKYFSPVENLSPGMECPVLFRKKCDGIKNESNVDATTDGEYVLAVENMVWGIIPTYLTAATPNDHYRMFNKRLDSLEPSSIAQYFRTVLHSKRCVVIFDGFYEWKLVAGKKQPYYIHLGGDKPMKMAGIYEESTVFDPIKGCPRQVKTFSIITHEACAKFSSIHDRQPVFLTDEQVLEWLEGRLHPGPGSDARGSHTRPEEYQFDVVTVAPGLESSCSSRTIDDNRSSLSTPAPSASKDCSGSGVIFAKAAESSASSQSGVFQVLQQLKNNHKSSVISSNKSIQFHPVSLKVTNARYQERDCTAPVSIGTQLTAFFRPKQDKETEKKENSSFVSAIDNACGSTSISSTNLTVGPVVSAQTSTVSAAESKVTDAEVKAETKADTLELAKVAACSSETGDGAGRQSTNDRGSTVVVAGGGGDGATTSASADVISLLDDSEGDDKVEVSVTKAPPAVHNIQHQHQQPRSPPAKMRAIHSYFQRTSPAVANSTTSTATAAATTAAASAVDLSNYKRPANNAASYTDAAKKKR